MTITGRVQGVGYRAWFFRAATAAGLHGWVRNRTDGSVEALIGEDEAACQALIAAAREGPPAARVQDVVVQPAQGMMPARFEIKPTV